MTAWVIGVHLLTAHAASGYEAVTPGIYARHESGFTVGAYRNSIGRESVYAGWTWETPDRRFALTAGGVTGYERKCWREVRNEPNGSVSTLPHCTGFEGGKVAPMLVPSMRLGSARLALVSLKRPALHLAWEF